MKRSILTVMIGMVVVGGIAVAKHEAHATQPGLAPNAVVPIDGKEIYLKSCKECHGVLGTPTKAATRKYDKIATFADPKFFETRNDEALIKAVTKGKGRDMKGFSEKLSSEEIKAVVEYIHTLKKK